MIQLRKVEALTSVEWYDGIVTGFIQLQDDIFLCILLALDVNRANRLYLLVHVASNTFPAIALDDMREYYQSTLKAAADRKAPLLVTNDEPLQGRELRLSEVTGSQSAHLELLQFPRIDEAVLESSVEQWL